jgi:quercetin dioxygenase-like cupin family protein
MRWTGSVTESLPSGTSGPLPGWAANGGRAARSSAARSTGARPERDDAPPQIEVVGSVPTPPVPDSSEAMPLLVTLPLGSAGSPPHRHTGPAFGYVIAGEMVFELEGEPESVVRGGETFWEPGRK